VLLDDLPGSPRIGDTGDIEAHVLAAMPTLLLPAITVGGHLCWALYVLELI
jgi:hypothetical protein